MTANSEERGAGGQRRTRGPYAKSAERRQQIIDKAIEIFARDGVDAGSLRSVAAAIGVSHAALRHYFPTREALLIAVYEAHEVRADETIDAWLGEEDSPLPAMRASASRNRSVPGLVQLYASLTAAAVQAGNPETEAFIRERFTSLRQQIARRVERAQRNDSMVGSADAADVASLIIAAADGLQIQWLLDPDAVAVERGLALLERLLDAGTTTAEQERAEQRTSAAQQTSAKQRMPGAGARETRNMPGAAQAHTPPAAPQAHTPPGAPQ